MPELVSPQRATLDTLRSEHILLVTAIAGAENCAAVVAKQFNLAVETVSCRRDALAALRRQNYAVVVLDGSLLEAAGGDLDAIFRNSGLAIPLEINFAISGCGRLVREIRAALSRRQLEQAVATRAAATSLETNLRDTVAGLLLQSQLALAEPSVPPQLAGKLRLMAELAGSLRQKLDQGVGHTGNPLRVPAHTGRGIGN
ncbi:MAG TPA: hypothetical protein VME86_12915 [Acidobacteriaceae bacterium]|nr:hypothetical protein [Acidobacteriaceae bacterium]